MIEDFFRLVTDGIMFHPEKLCTSELLPLIFQAGLTSLSLEKFEPLISVLHFYRDLLMYGDANTSPNSSLSNPRTNAPPEVQKAVTHLAHAQGEALTQAVMRGLMYSFPRDCVPDASGVIMALVQLVPEKFGDWVVSTLALLPAESLPTENKQKFLDGLAGAINSGDWKKVRYTLQDFTTWYRRKNVSILSNGNGTWTVC